MRLPKANDLRGCTARCQLSIFFLASLAGTFGQTSNTKGCSIKMSIHECYDSPLPVTHNVRWDCRWHLLDWPGPSLNDSIHKVQHQTCPGSTKGLLQPSHIPQGWVVGPQEGSGNCPSLQLISPTLFQRMTRVGCVCKAKNRSSVLRCAVEPPALTSDGCHGLPLSIVNCSAGVFTSVTDETIGKPTKISVIKLHTSSLDSISNSNSNSNLTTMSTPVSSPKTNGTANNTGDTTWHTPLIIGSSVTLFALIASAAIFKCVRSRPLDFSCMRTLRGILSIGKSTGDGDGVLPVCQQTPLGSGGHGQGLENRQLSNNHNSSQVQRLGPVANVDGSLEEGTFPAFATVKRHIAKLRRYLCAKDEIVSLYGKDIISHEQYERAGAQERNYGNYAGNDEILKMILAEPPNEELCIKFLRAIKLKGHIKEGLLAEAGVSQTPEVVGTTTN